MVLQGLATVGTDVKLDNRILDLRTATNQAIFRVEAGIMKLFRDFLTEQNFVEINTPKIISGWYILFYVCHTLHHHELLPNATMF